MIKKDRGFTLVELIIVIAILGIIALIAIPNLTGIRQRAQISADIRTAEQIGKAIRLWSTDTDAAMADGQERIIPSDKVLWYADNELVEGKFVGIDYYVSEGYTAESLANGNGTYFITSFAEEPSVQKVVVGIDQKAASGDANYNADYIVAKTLTVPADKATVISQDHWYKDGTKPGWAYLEQ